MSLVAAFDDVVAADDDGRRTLLTQNLLHNLHRPSLS